MSKRTDRPASKSAKRKKRLKSLVPVLLVLLILGWAFGQKVMQLSALKSELAEYELQKEAVLAQQDKLEKQIALYDDPAYMERLARSDLGMIREGEKLLVKSEEGQDETGKKDVQSESQDIH